MILLTGSCLAALVLLFGYEPPDPDSHYASAELDSLIYHELQLFNIPASRVNERTFEVDTTFSRTTYQVGVPQGLSRTFVHSELSQRLHEASFRTRGTVDFPDRDITMDITRDNTLLRRVRFVEDSENHRTLHLGSILVYFDHTPSQQEIDRLTQINEPIGLLLRGSSPGQLEHRFEQVSDYPYFSGFWAVGEDGSKHSDPDSFLEEVREFLSNPTLMTLSADGAPSSNTSDAADWLVADNAIMAGEEHGREAFNRDIIEFSNRAVRGEQPILLIKGTGNTLRWLDDGIFKLNKKGVLLSLPNQTGN